ncbi:MAG: Rrf2 family transcriptional regulator [Clostridia bacterium]
MKISTKGRYGLRAMIDLATHENCDYVTLASIAERQQISLNYLEHSFSALKKAGLIIGHTGINGGYKLALPPTEITLQMILVVLEGDLAIVPIIPAAEETIYSQCLRTNVWEKINQKLADILKKTTLQDMLGCNNKND